MTTMYRMEERAGRLGGKEYGQARAERLRAFTPREPQRPDGVFRACLLTERRIWIESNRANDRV